VTEGGLTKVARDETVAMGELAARGAGAMTDLVRDTHEAIAARSFAAAGASSAPARRGHDAIAALSYAAVKGLSGAALRVAGRVYAATTSRSTSLADTRRGSLAIGALNGLYGDRLAERRDPLATRTELRHEGRSVPLGATALAARFPAASERIVVFVHGLCETEHAWWLGVDPERGVDTYGARLACDLGHTPLYVRYNTGLHISTAGRELSGLLDELIEAWPVPVEEVVFVGHSMGGLVARSACQAALEGPRGSWVELVRHVFYLGSPHTGADLEKGANVAGWLLAALPESRPFARMLNARSAGIKDLRYGYLLDADWAGRDPDERLRSYRHDEPFLDSATHYFIAATLTADASHPLGRVVGDLLVRQPSAWAGDQHAHEHRFDLDRSSSIGPLSHVGLLNHPAVYDQLRRWVAPPSDDQ
jgi:pimeloyl-ACP methyl ester carboxylesterase